MPLTTTIETPQQLAKTLEKELEATGSSSFAVIYASHVDGQSWCGDCRAAEPIVEKKFGGKYGEKIWVVYAGDKVEWRAPDNPWRKEPFKITHLPTLVKFTPEEKWEKLVETDVYNQKKLDAFVGF